MGEQCDVCGREVPVAGGIADFWTLDHTDTEGLTLELADGTEHFLCYRCIDLLPEDREPTAEDVEAVRDQVEHTDPETGEPTE